LVDVGKIHAGLEAQIADGHIREFVRDDGVVLGV
jgi:hypothetical protein